MSTSDIRSRGRRFNLPTQQRRLRHLRSIAARNIVVRSRPSDADVDVTSLETYLTLHSTAHSDAFFTSERIKGSLNPTWRSFNLQHMNVSGLNTAAPELVARVWRGKNDNFRLILEWHVSLSGLVYIGDKLQQDGISYRPNTLIFGMFEGYYSEAPTQTPGSISNQSTSSSVGAGSPGSEKEVGITVEAVYVRDSYSANSLSRIQTVLRAITQTQASVKKVRSNIEVKLSQSQQLAAKKQEEEMLALRVEQLKTELSWRTAQLRTEKEAHETKQANIHQRDVVLKTKYETLARDKERLHDKKRAYFDVREDLIKTGAQLVMRRKQLISELALIYPVQELENGDFTICGVKLPNSEDFSGNDEVMVAVALGYTTHLVQMINSFLDVPLRYPMEHRGSRSRITDHIHDKLTDKDRDFPLYSKGKEKFQFNYGVYLLNKNIAQLRYYCGLGTTDLRLTLPNLKSLLELRLGVKFDPSTNSLAVTPSQHVPLPPNLGGPQKLTSNFNSRLTPRPDLLTPADGKTPSRSESEDSKFEQMLQETTHRRRKRMTGGSSTGSGKDGKQKWKSGEDDDDTESSARSTPETSDTSSASPKSAASGNHTPGDIIPATSTPTVVTVDDDPFKASPDAFFQITQPATAASHAKLDDSPTVDVVSTNGTQEQLELAEEVLTGETKASEADSFREQATFNTQPKVALVNPSPGPQLRNKHLQGPLADGYIDSDVSSNEENINDSYGSKFKTWPREPVSHHGSDNEHQHSGEEDVVNTALPEHRIAPGLSAEDVSSDFSFQTNATFKTRAMKQTVQPLPHAASHTSRAACFTRTTNPRPGQEIMADHGSPYEDDICERTDALTTSLSTFKVKFPASRGTGSVMPLGVLDDAVPSGGESDH